MTSSMDDVCASRSSDNNNKIKTPVKRHRTPIAIPIPVAKRVDIALPDPDKHYSEDQIPAHVEDRQLEAFTHSQEVIRRGIRERQHKAIVRIDRMNKFENLINDYSTTPVKKVPVASNVQEVSVIDLTSPPQINESKLQQLQQQLIALGYTRQENTREKMQQRIENDDENECLDPSFCVKKCPYSTGSLEEQRFVLMKRLHQLNLAIERRDMSVIFRLSAC